MSRKTYGTDLCVKVKLEIFNAIRMHNQFTQPPVFVLVLQFNAAKFMTPP